MYKVLIPSAGLGTRLGDLGKNFNKALVTVANKPVISHVIEKFSKEIEIVIAVGHKGDLLKDYLSIAHFDRNITYVEIDHYFGSKSGLGYSILQCEKHLQCPFIFSPNDTLVLEDIPPPHKNWMGYADIPTTDQFRSIKVDKNKNVSEIYEKGDGIDVKPYIGLAGISDYEKFWSNMKSGVSKGSILIGESYALRKLLQNNKEVLAKKFSWYDTGTRKNLKETRRAFQKKDDPNILHKPDEAIWFANNRVIKYHSDSQFISNRVDRAALLGKYVPEIKEHRKNMYSYEMVTGQTVSRVASTPVFDNLLRYLKNFWTKQNLSLKEEKEFKQTCNKFYKHKTLKRVKLYFDKFSEIDTVENINGVDVPKLQDLLSQVPWERLANGLPVRFHGDLHFENILMSHTGNFHLIDWRQDFGGIKKYGDIYYELAKLLHGLIVSHELINKENYSIQQTANIITYDLHRKHSLVKNEKQLYDFVDSEGLDCYKVKLLTYLIFLNIAALHHDPYSKMLFYLGKEGLFNLLEENK